VTLPTFRGASTWTNGTGAITNTPHASTATGDLMLLIVETRATQSTGTPSGWTQVTGSPQDSGAAGLTETRLAVYWKIATAPEGAVSIADSGDHQQAVILSYAGAIGIDASVGGITTPATTSFSIGGVTTTTPDCMVVDVITQSASGTQAWGSWANANLSSLVERFDTGGGGSVTAGIAANEGGKASAGATGATTVTNSVSTTAAWMKIALASQAAAVATGHSFAAVIG